MIGVWPHWLRPGAWLLLPLLAWLLWQLWRRQQRLGRWETLLPPAFQRALLARNAGQRSKLPSLLLGLGWLLATLALVGPSWQRVEQSTQKTIDPLVVILEVTPEMLANDLPPSRLEQAKRKLLDLLQARSTAQTAIVVYAGSAHVLTPLSDDLATSANVLNAVTPAIMPQAGQRADLAVTKAIALLDQAAQGAGRVLWLGSSLSDAERDGIEQALAARPTNLRLLGIGTAQGAPIAQANGAFVKDAKGAIVLPRLDNASLDDFARHIDGAYRPGSVDNSDLRELGLLDLAQGKGSANGANATQTTRLDAWADQGYWLVLPLLLLAACAARRGWLYAWPLWAAPLLLGLCLTPTPSEAASFTDLWWRADQQGQHLLEQARPQAAAQHFQDPRWQGIALYQAGDYAGAAQRFAQGKRAVDYYNLGNALAKGGELEAALDAYAQALEKQPDFSAATTNKRLVEEQLRLNRHAADTRDATGQTAKDGGSAASGARQSSSVGATTSGTGNGATANTRSTSGGTMPSTPSSGQMPPGAGEQGSKDGSSNNAESGAGSAAAQANANKTPAMGVPGADMSNKRSSTEDANSKDKSAGKMPGQALPANASPAERQQAMEQWLRQIPDNPGELLRRKFWYEQQQHQDARR